MAFRVELQKEAPTDHVPGRSIGLSPVPPTAEFLRYEEPALVRITRDEFSYVLYLPFGKDPAPVPNPFIHHLYVSQGINERKDYFRPMRGSPPKTGGLLGCYDFS